MRNKHESSMEELEEEIELIREIESEHDIDLLEEIDERRNWIPQKEGYEADVEQLESELELIDELEDEYDIELIDAKIHREWILEKVVSDEDEEDEDEVEDEGSEEPWWLDSVMTIGAACLPFVAFGIRAYEVGVDTALMEAGHITMMLILMFIGMIVFLSSLVAAAKVVGDGEME